MIVNFDVGYSVNDKPLTLDDLIVLESALPNKTVGDCCGNQTGLVVSATVNDGTLSVNISVRTESVVTGADLELKLGYSLEKAILITNPIQEVS